MWGWIIVADGMKLKRKPSQSYVARVYQLLSCRRGQAMFAIVLVLMAGIFAVSNQLRMRDSHEPVSSRPQLIGTTAPSASPAPSVLPNGRMQGRGEEIIISKGFSFTMIVPGGYRWMW